MAISTNSTGARMNEAPNRQHTKAKEVIAEINGIRVEKSVIINRDRSDLYHFWRNFRNLPQIMNHLEEVRELSPTHSHWVAKAPVGTKVEWDAEVTHDQENELIAWRSLEARLSPTRARCGSFTLPSTRRKCESLWNTPRRAGGSEPSSPPSSAKTPSNRSLKTWLNSNAGWRAIPSPSTKASPAKK
jgi:hypothetical protein